VAGVLALGMAALVLSALALAPPLLRGLSTDRGEPPLTIPVLTGVAALVLVLLFGFGRAIDRIRRDLRADAALPDAAGDSPPGSGAAGEAEREEPRAD
ncbi:hypothetical protein, partial [Micromonospora sp. AMSO31t]|uniref:hypothetical protein n=1 Tax=Micromonospora sp. AMSO31t TaxID=2650566 RepID=UPI00351ABF7B